MASVSNLVKDKLDERRKRLHELHLKRNEARSLNHHEVVEEDRRKKLPENWEAKRARLEWELADQKKKNEAKERGEDYERVKSLETGAGEAQRLERNQKRKKNQMEAGFSDYQTQTERHYNKLIRQLKPDHVKYEEKKQELGEEVFYAGANTVLQGLHTDTKEAVERMVEDLEKQIGKRAKFSRRRLYNDDADIDYINERNRIFNEKLERNYGQYTSEIKQNLERGTAV
ncbi:pre-mRNA-splicing factor syf2 [Chamberlinius hualienensis]